jgi:peptidoglycan/xylan/chitin deacetylase (PgdA/CDA1 family)
MLIRNCFCGLLALALIMSGRVNRAMRRALGGDVVTAIYFHKPNRRLFARCIQWLTKHGYTFISIGDLMEILYRGKTPPKGAVWLSFDDGCRELLTNVLPLIRKNRIPVTLFLPSGIIDGDGLFPWMNGRRRSDCIRDSINLAEIKEIASYPEVTIASHTVHHVVTTDLTHEQARFEFTESRRALESYTHAVVKYFAYPEGQFSGNERQFLMQCGYDLAATTENAFITRKTDPYLVPRFSVADEISFPEAICNMVGVWRPAIEPLERCLKRRRRETAIRSDMYVDGARRTAGVRAGQNDEQSTRG